MLDVSIAAILETKDRRIILVNGHIINVYRYTTSNPDKINWEELEPVLPCLSAEVEFIVISRVVRERCNSFINKSYPVFSLPLLVCKHPRTVRSFSMADRHIKGHGPLGWFEDVGWDDVPGCSLVQVWRKFRG